MRKLKLSIYSRGIGCACSCQSNQLQGWKNTQKKSYIQGCTKGLRWGNNCCCQFAINALKILLVHYLLTSNPVVYLAMCDWVFCFYDKTSGEDWFVHLKLCSQSRITVEVTAFCTSSHLHVQYSNIEYLVTLTPKENYLLLFLKQLSFYGTPVQMCMFHPEAVGYLSQHYKIHIHALLYVCVCETWMIIIFF